MILLDTNAVLWLLTGHDRSRPLTKQLGYLYLSPVSVLELKLLIESGRIREAPGKTLSMVTQDPRWVLDSPPSDKLFAAAVDIDWTRDPFDRLLVAHAVCRRWRLATGDQHILGNLSGTAVLSL